MLFRRFSCIARLAAGGLETACTVFLAELVSPALPLVPSPLPPSPETDADAEGSGSGCPIPSSVVDRSPELALPVLSKLPVLPSLGTGRGFRLLPQQQTFIH